MSENKKSFPPPVPKRKPQGFRSKSGEGSSMQRMISIDYVSDRPEANPSSPSFDQTTVKPPLSDPLNPPRSTLYPQQPNLTPSIPHPINQLSSSMFVVNQRLKIEPTANQSAGEGASTANGPLLLGANLQTNRLSAYFSASESGRAYTDSDFQKISNLLKDTGRLTWSTVPRIYTVLRLIGQLQIIDTFIDQGITDIWFPFSTFSLPNALGSALHPQFLDVQKRVLTKSIDLEKDGGRKHASFGRDEALPFKVEKELGGGRFSQVHKITSMISKREFARKQFRRGAGLRNAAEIKSFMVELQVLKKIHHHHCVELIASYTDPKWFALIMSPVADCDLKAFYSLCKGDEGRMDTLRTFYGCLAAALDYLHTSKIRHRDIKPQNILVKGVTVYLTDFGISLDWEGLSRSTTTEDSAKTVLYCAPEVAGYKPRNTASDVWSLGCVFLEIATVLAGLEVEDMQQFFRTTNGDYRFYTNIGIIPNWSSFIASKLPPGDDAPLEWVSEMLLLDPPERPSTTYLVNSITQNTRAHHSSTTRFCGSCCEVEISSDDSGSDGELWADNYETVKPRKDPEIESLSKLVKQQQLSSPPARNLPPFPSNQPLIIEDLPTRRDIPLADGIGNGTEQSIWGRIDADYKFAIEARKNQEKAREERQTRNSELDDDDDDVLSKLSQEEYELRRRELKEPNASVSFNPLFDDDPIQVPQFADFNQGYQQRDKSPPKLSFIALKDLLSANEQDHIKRDSPTSSLGLRPEEKRVYGNLFREADLDGIGVVPGEDAVKLFEKTGLEPRILGEIWHIVDKDNLGLLTPASFGSMLRLIGHCQAGREPTAELVLQPGPLAKFASGSAPSISPTIQPLLGRSSSVLQPQSSGSGPIKVPPLTSDKASQYTALFEKTGARNGVLQGEIAAQIFERSGLPNVVLGRIWNLVDTEQRGSLQVTEFVIALHLLASVKTGALYHLPDILPAELYEVAAGRRIVF